MSTASSSVRCIVPEMKNFVLTDRLGSGTYATVYKAYKKVHMVCTTCMRLNYTSSHSPILVSCQIFRPSHKMWLLGSTIKNGHREQSEPGSIYEVAIGMSGSLLVPSLGPRR